MNTAKVDWDDCCCNGPFHEGECEVQKKTGEQNIAKRVGRVITDRIPSGAIEFISKQPLVVTSSMDNDGNIWSSILVGNTGFVTASDEKKVHISVSSIISSKVDPFWENITKNKNIGMLFIELATRKRLRLNGTVSVHDENINVSVKQAYPNCPKYIQRRELEFTKKDNNHLVSILDGSFLTNDLKEWIKASDTLFIGSSDSESNLDASHRGGNPGFVEIIDDSTLKIPDYPGNSMFNTLGNFVSNPNAGLLFVDFNEGKTLQLTGNAEIVWCEEKTEEKTGGTMRFWIFLISKWVQIESLKGINWKFIDYSPFNP